MGRLQLEKTRLKEQCELEALRGGRTRNLFDIAIETNRRLRKNIRELRDQYDKELSGLRYELDGLQARLATFGSRI